MVPMKPHGLPEQQALTIKALLSLSADAIIMINRHGTITNISDSASILFGYEYGTLLGRNISELMPRADAAAHQGYVDKFLETGNAKIIGHGRNVHGLHKDGRVIPISIQVAEVWDGGDPVFVSFIKDRTAELTAAAREEDLRAALEMTAKQAALGEFAAGIAHEVNQPLTAIDQYLSTLRILLNKDSLDKEQSLDLVEKASAQCQRAANIIRSLRRFVRGGPFRPIAFDMPQLVDETIALSLRDSERDAIQVRNTSHTKSQLASGDPIQVQQVIHNLLRNAVDAVSAQEQAAIEIDCDSDGTLAKVCVRDNGTGVSPEVADTIFNRFSTTKTNGMGIGLALSKSIVEAHGGKIWLDENTPQGSAFCFTIPSPAQPGAN